MSRARGAIGTETLRRLSVLLVYVLAIGMAVLLGRSVAGGRWSMVVLAMALPLAAMAVFLNPTIAIGVAGAVFYGGERLVGLGYLPQQVVWVPDLLVVALLSRIIILSKGRRTDLGGPPAVALLGLISLALVSAQFNGLGPVGTVVGLRYLFRFVAYYIVVLNLGLSEKVMRRFVWAIVAVGVLQVPVSLAQYAARGHVSDLNSGTMHLFGGEEMAFVCTAAATILLSLYLQGRGRRWLPVLVVMLWLPGVATGARASLVFFPVVVAIATLYAFAVRPGKAAGRLAAAVPMVIIVVAVLVSSAAFGAMMQRNVFAGLQGALAIEQTGGAEFGRITSWRNTLAILRGDAMRSAIGYGPGTTGESAFAYGSLRSAMVSEGAFRHQLSATAIELGFVGLVLMVGAVLLAFRALPPPSAYTDDFWFAVRISVPVILGLYLLLFFYYQVWISGATSFLVWTLVGITRLVGHQAQEDATCGS